MKLILWNGDEINEIETNKSNTNLNAKSYVKLYLKQ